MSSTGEDAHRDARHTGGGDGRPRGRAEASAAIVAAAAELFRAKGPAGVSMREIAHHAGVNYGLLHRHFGTKEAVIAAVFREASRRGAQTLDEATGVREALEVLTARIGERDYAHMLAWAALDGSAPAAFVDDAGAFARLRELATTPGGGSATEERIALAAALAMLLGWQVLAPYLTSGLGLGDVDPGRLEQAVSRRVIEAGTT